MKKDWNATCKLTPISFVHIIVNIDLYVYDNAINFKDQWRPDFKLNHVGRQNINPSIKEVSHCQLSTVYIDFKKPSVLVFYIKCKIYLLVVIFIALVGIIDKIVSLWFSEIRDKKFNKAKLLQECTRWLPLPCVIQTVHKEFSHCRR